MNVCQASFDPKTTPTFLSVAEGKMGEFLGRRLLCDHHVMWTSSFSLQHLHEELIDELHRHLYIKATARKTHHQLLAQQGESHPHRRWSSFFSFSFLLFLSLSAFCLLDLSCQSLLSSPLLSSPLLLQVPLQLIASLLLPPVL